MITQGGESHSSHDASFSTFANYEDYTVEGSFVDDSGTSTRYTVSAAASFGGNIFEEGLRDVAEGEVLSFALLPADGYAIGPVTGSCGGTVDTQTKLFTSNPVTADCTVVANFVTDDIPADRHTVTPSATSGGMISPLGDQSVANGGIITFVVQTEPGFAFGPVTGTCGGTFNTISKTFTTNLINQDCTVVATFVDNGGTHHLVTPSVDVNWPGGSIAPASAQDVAEGGVITFNLFPEPGFAIRAVEGNCGGRLDRMSNNFTTDAVTQPCEVIASFVSDTPATRHTVSSSAGTGGNIHLAGTQEVAHGGVLTFAILPMYGYDMGPMGGTCGGNLNSQTKLFTTNPVTQDCSVEASFVAQGTTSYTVTSSTGTGGTITPEGTQSVVQGGVTSFQLLPDNGYALGPVLGSCGGTLDTTAQTFTILGVSQDCTVEATFVDSSVTDYTVTASAGAGGSINPDGAQTVNEGGVLSFQLLPEQGFAVGPVNGNCSGTLDTQTKTFTTDAITGDCSVEATFVDATGTAFAVTTSVVGPGGSIAPDEYAAVAKNGVVSFSLHPAPYYSIGSVAGCNGTLSGKTYLTGEIVDNCTVVATFVRNNYLLTVTKTGTGADHGIIGIDTTPDLTCIDNIATGTYTGTVFLTATPEDSAKFVGWSGCTTVTDNTCTVNMNGDQEVAAEFYYFPWPMFMPAITGAGDR